MKIKNEPKTLRVAVQRTISPRRFSLIAEENLHPYRKGDLVKTINPSTLAKMARPLSVCVSENGGGENPFSVKPVMAIQTKS